MFSTRRSRLDSRSCLACVWAYESMGMSASQEEAGTPRQWLLPLGGDLRRIGHHTPRLTAPTHLMPKSLANAHSQQYSGAQDRPHVPRHLYQGEAAPKQARKQPNLIHDVMTVPGERGFRPAQGQGMTCNVIVSSASPNKRPPPAPPGKHIEAWTTRLMSNAIATNCLATDPPPPNA